MNRDEKLKQLRSKDVITVCFVKNASPNKFKNQLIYDEMAKNPRFKPVIIDSKIGRMPDYNKYDIVFFTEPYECFMGSLKSKLYNDCKLAMNNYGFYWDLRQKNNPMLKKALFTFYDHAQYLEALGVKPDDAKNFYLTGNPYSVQLLQDASKFSNPWKTDKKHVIVSLHWTFHACATTCSSLIKYSNTLLDIMKKYKDQIEFKVKMHPLLENFYRTKRLPWNCKNSNKTDRDNAAKVRKTLDAMLKLAEKYDNDKDNVALFKHSDAMIHDCGSFRCEYLHVNKPCCYMCNDINYQPNAWTMMGKDAINAHVQARSGEDIENFIKSVLDGKDEKKELRQKWLETYVYPTLDQPSPAQRIINAILGV